MEYDRMINYIIIHLLNVENSAYANCIQKLGALEIPADNEPPVSTRSLVAHVALSKSLVCFSKNV